jgi:hypothetical protein
MFVLILFMQTSIADDRFGDLVDPTAPIAFGLSGITDEKGMPDVDSYVSFTGQKSYSLSSVLIMQARKYAVINGQMVEEGQLIGAALVKEIDRNGVTLEQGQRINRLTLHAGTVRKEGQ